MNCKLIMPYIIKISLSVTGLLFVCFDKPVEAQSAKASKISATIETGYFQENFRWSIAGQNSLGEPVNILSELRWEKLNGPLLKVNADYNFWKGCVLRSNFSNSFITAGKVGDTDFQKDNRKDTSYHDVLNSYKGRITSFDLAIGYKIIFFKKCSITPFVGAIINAQSLFLLRNFDNGMEDLHSTYKTRWRGVTAGFDARIPLYNKVILESQFVYNQVNYSSKANWNLIPDFQHPVSFRHSAVGFGIEPTLKVHYIFSNKLSAFVSGTYFYWTTGKGTDTLYKTNGDIFITQFNGAKRNGFIISIGTKFRL